MQVFDMSLAGDQRCDFSYSECGHRSAVDTEENKYDHVQVVNHTLQTNLRFTLSIQGNVNVFTSTI